MQPPRGFSIFVLLGASFASAGQAAAVEDMPEPDLTADGPRASNGPVNVLPDAVSARVSVDRATATSWAGYDGGKRAPLVTAAVEARIVGRLVIAAGVGYTAELPGAPAFRPQIGLRAQLLDQARHGLDGGVAVMYRQDLFSDEEGFIQGTLAIERQQGPLRVVGNVLYGQDGEGDDRAGEMRLAALLATRPGLLVGLDGRYRQDLWSSDQNRAARNRPEYELTVGPTASYARGSWAVMAETGVSTVRTTTTHTGVLALGGLASSF